MKEVMRREHWICRDCLEIRCISAGGWHMLCANCRSPLKMIWHVSDLSCAKFVDYKRFRIESLYGYWEYVPHAHAGCLKRAPEEGHIVARVHRHVGHDQAMTFRRATRPRAKK